KLRGSGEFAVIARLHAAHFCRFLEQRRLEFGSISKRLTYEYYGEHLGNVRAALEWSFGPDGAPDVGIALGAASAPLFVQLSLLGECTRWTEQALGLLGEEERGTPCELHLQASRGQALMFTRGNSEDVRGALLRALEIAERVGDVPFQLQMLANL